MQLKQISRILVNFSPWTGEAKSAREFLARISSAKARASNPKCEVETKVRLKGDAFVEIIYQNKAVETITTGDKTVGQILEIVQNRAEEMDTAAKLKEAGLQGQPIDSTWGSDALPDARVGVVGHIPRVQ